jgi:DNA-directed RNA polymerase specialized sigma subunit
LTAERHSHTDDIQRTAGITDPVTRFTEAGELQEQCAHATRALADIRKSAVAQMHEGGMTYKEIGAALSISTGRASQLAGSGWTHTVIARRNA